MTEKNKEKKKQSADRAQRISDMQTRVFNNQLEIMERNLKKKLKLIENEKIQVAQYLRFLRSSSGKSPFSIAPDGKEDIPRMRPSTARVHRFKFGCDGNVNHCYMTSDPTYGWPSSYYSRGNPQSKERAKSACMSRNRMTTFRTTMSRIIKVEARLQKRVSWIDGGDKGDKAEDDSQGLSTDKETPSKLDTVLPATQSDLGPNANSDSSNLAPVVKDDVENVTSNSINLIQNSAKKKLNRRPVLINRINVTFPLPAISKNSKPNTDASQFLSHDRQLNTSPTSKVSRQSIKQNIS